MFGFCITNLMDLPNLFQPSCKTYKRRNCWNSLFGNVVEGKTGNRLFSATNFKYTVPRWFVVHNTPWACAILWSLNNWNKNFWNIKELRCIKKKRTLTFLNFLMVLFSTNRAEIYKLFMSRRGAKAQKITTKRSELSKLSEAISWAKRITQLNFKSLITNFLNIRTIEVRVGPAMRDVAKRQRGNVLHFSTIEVRSFQGAQKITTERNELNLKSQIAHLISQIKYRTSHIAIFTYQ